MNKNSDEDKTSLKENKLKENRVLRGLIILSVIVIGGLLLTWAFPRNIAEKPPAVPAPNNPPQDSVTIITQKVNEIQGVKGAQVIVLSRTALIVLDVGSGVAVSEVKRIKNEAAVKAKDVPEVDEVLVTANPDLAAEVKKILDGEVSLERLDYIYELIKDQGL